MAVRKKKTGLLKNMNPTTAAVIGAATGFGAAKLAIYAGEKLPEKITVPAFMRKTNVGTHAAAALGVVLTIFGKSPAAQGAGVGMIVTVLPEYVEMITGDNENPNETGKRLTRRTEMQELTETETDEPLEPEAVNGDGPYFDVLQAISAGENLNLYN